MKKHFFRQLKTSGVKIFWITIGWTVVSVYQFLNGYTVLLQLKCAPFHDPFVFVKGSIFTGILAGLIGGSLMVFLWERWLRTKTYGLSLFLIFLSYTGSYTFVSVLTGLFLHSNSPEIAGNDISAWEASMDFFFSLAQLHSYLLWLFIVLGTLVFLLVNDKYGPGVFISFLLGRYFQPKREERIFMFLDLRSSTIIAEKLGEERYFHFLKDVFEHATPGILKAGGEIYQYVGDEIVITWKMDKGIKNVDCVNCFFEVQQDLIRKSDYYNKNYDGMVPVFKAGLHYGFVMAGEIGVVKRDIAFSGDVLNTASRIQGKCNELGVDILISDTLFDRLRLPAHTYQPKQIGNIMLRGKKEALNLYTV